MTATERPSDAAVAELRNIADARRFNREDFADDAEFADWAQSRARHCLRTLDAAPADPVVSGECWREAIQEMVVEVGLSGLYPEELEWIEQRASELAKEQSRGR